MKSLQPLNQKNFSEPNSSKPIVINIVMDGIGLSKYIRNNPSTPPLADQQLSEQALLEAYRGDAAAAANTPTLNQLKTVCQDHGLYRELFAHGTFVGLPTDDDMGNSEVGHNAIGSGRIFPQGAKLINLAIKENQLTESDTWKELCNYTETHNSRLHLIGLLSDGYVHSHIDHLKYLILKAAEANTKEVFVHAILDGRDVSAHSSPEYMEDLLNYFQEIESKYTTKCQVASAGGRMLMVMDRYEANWPMIEKGWKVMVEGKAEREFEDPLEGIRTLQAESKTTDQYLTPFVVTKNGQPIGPIKDGDSVVLFNFRGDRAIEICRAFENPNLDTIKREKYPKVFFAGIMEYDPDKKIPTKFLVHPTKIDHPIGEYLVEKKIHLFAVSETQKYGHVTYFWNGNRSKKFSDKLEKYIEIKNPDVPFEQQPWMKCAEITDTTIDLILSGKYQYGRINYPNGDMVGHTGDFNAARMSVEAVDISLGRILEAISKVGGIAIVTADHGNCDEMLQVDKQGELKKDKNGEYSLKTSHTLNPVPFYIFDSRFMQLNHTNTSAEKNISQPYHLKPNTQNEGIANIASTTLELLGYQAPEDYKPSLISWN